MLVSVYSLKYSTVVFRVVLYGCESWSLTLREESGLRVFENRVPRRILEPKRDEVIGSWRKLHTDRLYKLYLSSYTLVMINQGG
jgi:hypothetical protein